MSTPKKPKPAEQAPEQAVAHDAAAEVNGLVQRGLKALAAYADFTQEQIDYIVKKASIAALHAHGTLAAHAVEETGRGIFEDKATKNIFACEHVTHSMAKMKTVGVIGRDDLRASSRSPSPWASSPASPR